MFMKPGRILNDIYAYELDTTVQQFFPTKGRRGGILELVSATIYNSSGNAAANFYWLLKIKGVIRRVSRAANVNAKITSSYWKEIYLDDGDEWGFEIDGGAVGDVMEYQCQALWHKVEDE
jgi:hypothetical protein